MAPRYSTPAPRGVFYWQDAMSKARQTFRASELTRAIKATLAAGVSVDRAEIDPSTGKIVVVICQSGASPADNRNEWDNAE